MKKPPEYGGLIRQAEEAARLKKAAVEPAALRSIVEISRRITGALAKGRKVLLCGNGGSAADCQHWAGEMIGRFKKERKSWPFIALTTDTSILTSIANDYDYSRAFARQVEGLGKKGDILICISTSGRSPGVIAAAKTAGRQGLVVIGFTGRAPNPLARLADAVFAVPSTDTPRIQEAHIFAVHLICGLVEETLS